METRTRSWVKAALWSLIGLTVMSLVGLIFTGSLAAGGAMALLNTGIGFTAYLAYERIWARIRWGLRDA